MLRGHIDHLPSESATKTALLNALTPAELAAAQDRDTGDHGPWSRADHLAAAELDVMRLILHVLVADRGGKSKPPEPIPRPGVSSQRKVEVTPEAVEYARRLREEHRRTHGYG